MPHKWSGKLPPVNYLTKEKWINKCKNKYGDTYAYSKVNWDNRNTPVTIICPIHGDFTKSPVNFLRSGCSKCGYSNIKTLNGDTEEVFINKCKNKYGDTYAYSKVVYSNSQSYVTITCHKHGDWNVRPYNFLQGTECPLCSIPGSKTRQYFVNFF